MKPLSNMKPSIAQKSHLNNEQHTKEVLDWTNITWMITIHILSIVSLWHTTTGSLICCFILFFVTGCLGITFCFHRLLSHKSFKAHPIIEGITAFCGTLAMQGTVQEWVFHHRHHHRSSDTRLDPHNAKRGFWYSHIGWILYKNPIFTNNQRMNKTTKDIMLNKWLRFLSKKSTMILSQCLLAMILYALGGWAWVGSGIFLRLVLVYHTTWLVNSATHKWGYRNFSSGDLAVNTWWVALLTWGEGWHNNHHRHPHICTTRYRWWELDITYFIVKFFEFFGLVHHVKKHSVVEHISRADYELPRKISA